jgi:hypothetical protein
VLINLVFFMYFEDSAKWLKDSNFLMVLIGLGLVYITFKVLKYTNKRVCKHCVLVQISTRDFKMIFL